MSKQYLGKWLRKLQQEPRREVGTRGIEWPSDTTGTRKVEIGSARLWPEK